MSKLQIPKTDSIKELADFWDRHNLTDFNDELEEVKEPVFKKSTDMLVHLDSDDYTKVDQLARQAGKNKSDLIHDWIKEKVSA